MSPTNTSYYITSPGFPTGYGPNLECSWIISSPPGTHLIFWFLDLDLEESNGCITDHVDIYSGYVRSSMLPPDTKLHGKYCLSNESSLHVETTNIMTVKFISDIYINNTGFKGVVYVGQFLLLNDYF